MLYVYDGTKLLYESRGNNTFKVPKTGTYTLFVEWYYRNPGITIYWDELSCITKTLTTVTLEEGVLLKGPVEYSKTDAFYGDTITATLPNVTDLNGVVYQWKYNDPETGVGKDIKGENGPSIKLNKTEYVNKYVASFVGMAPAGQPRIIVAVMIDEPTKGSHYGGTVAGPVFNEVAAGALRLIGVHPDDPHAVSGTGIFVKGIRND